MLDTSNVDRVFIGSELRKWKGKLVGIDVAHVGKPVTETRHHILAQTGWPESILDTSIPEH